MPLTRAQVSQIYRPIGPKPVQTGLSPVGFNANTFGGQLQLAQFLDLTYPILGLRFVFKGRLVVAGANFTTAFPESFLNLISNITLQGTNKRAGGNVVLWNIDGATLYNLQSLFDVRACQFDINGTEVAPPNTPTPAYSTLAIGTYDFRIAMDLPFYTFNAPDGFRPAFQMRKDEWGSSPQLSVTFGTQAGNATGALGVAAAATTCTYSAFQSGAGTPTLDIYSLPLLMGLDLAPSVTPGFLTRVSTPINTVLQSAGGAGTKILDLQKQATTRVFFKVGTSTVPNGNPAFATVTDTNVSALGIKLGGTQIVRNEVDVFAHKQDLLMNYDMFAPIQGYNCLDFIQSGDPGSAYPGDQVQDGSTFQLTGTIAGVANGYGIVIQEQALYSPEGPLYSF